MEWKCGYMKIPKFPLIFTAISLAISIILTVFPDFVISYIKSNMTSDIPSYKFTEAIQMWQISKVTIFQPLSYVFYIVTIIIFVYAVFKWITMNYVGVVRKD